MTDRELMELAILTSKEYTPDDPAKTPQVGAVIAIDGRVIALGCRGQDDHAEMTALSRVVDRSELPKATVYTTLEPCTQHVRRDPLGACVELLTAAQVKKVFVGILDPNQWVCGRGVLALQKCGIEVELFHHDLAQSIRNQLHAFVKAQQSLGVELVDPPPGERPRVVLGYGDVRLRVVCRCNDDLPKDVFVLVRRGSNWFPQEEQFRRQGDGDTWESVASFGAAGEHEVHVVRASELGVELIRYYRKMVDARRHERRAVKAEYGVTADKLFGPRYPSIEMTHLPKGLDSLASFSVEVVKTDAGPAS